MIALPPDLAAIWAWLGEVADPEIPAVSVVDLGIVRDLAWFDGADARAGVRVTLTPTYSGCPATRAIQADITRALHDHGIGHVEIALRLAPPWTTDWLSAAGRDKLRAYGIAPPDRAAADVLDITAFVEPDITCPRCTSGDVTLTSRFGSTPCKALYRCNACREPFDHFKCH